MAAGDLRGHFDVAYSLEFGLGTLKDPEPWLQHMPAKASIATLKKASSCKERAYEIYQQILTAQANHSAQAT